MAENTQMTIDNLIEDKYKKIVDDINIMDEITLSDTVELMKSDDYKIRFIAEYMQVKIRYNNLHIMNVKYEAGTLNFEPSCPLVVLKSQESCMRQYMEQLEIRAQIEKIELPKF